MGQQLWSIDSLGGFLSNNELSKMIRHSAQPIMRFRQFVDPEPASGKNRGDKVFFNKISNISTQGGTLNETATIPKRNYTILQGTLTITEAANAIPYTLKSQTLSDVTVPDIVKTVLRNDMAKVLDTLAYTEFATSDIDAVCTSTSSTVITTGASVSATASADMSDKNVRDIIDQLKKFNVPRVDGQKYVCVSSTNSIRGLYDFFEAKAQQTTMEPLFSGEVGTYYGTRFVEETNILSNVLGSASVFGEALFFGADAVREGIAIPEDIRIDLPKDFGRDQGIAWYYLGGFVKTWDFSEDTETRIIHLTSA